MLLFDNAVPYMAKATTDNLTQLVYDQIPHPPYSPLSMRLLLPEPAEIHGWEGQTQDDLEHRIQQWTGISSKQFWKDGVKGLAERCQQPIDLDGEYLHQPH